MTEFWERLFRAIPELEKLIDIGGESKTQTEIEKVFDVISNLLKESKVNCRIILSVGKRYGAKYPGNSSVIEIAFGVHREAEKSVEEIEELFKHIPDFKKVPHPKRWFFTKFNPPNIDFMKDGFKYKIENEPIPDLLDSDVSESGATGSSSGSSESTSLGTASSGTESTSVGGTLTETYITQDDIKVGLRVTESETNLVVVVRDELRDILLDDRVVKGKKMYVPKSQEMKDLIVGCVGEYHMIRTINTMSFGVESDFKGVPGLIPINKVQALFPKVDCCEYCGIPSYSAILLSCSKCKKIKYCGIKCQVYHFPTHKTACAK